MHPTTAASEKVRAQTRNTLVYGDGGSGETLDIYYPSQGKIQGNNYFKVIILFHTCFAIA